MRLLRIVLSLSLIVLSFVLSATAEPPAPFTTIDFPGALSSRAFGINAPGEIVGLYRDATDKEHGFLLNRGSFSTIEFPRRALYLGLRDQRPRRDRGWLRGRHRQGPWLLT